MRVNLRLQTYTTTLPEYVKYDVYFPKVHQAALLPLFQVHIRQDVSAAQARTFRQMVYGTKTFAKGVYISGYALGGIFMALGAFMLLSNARPWRRFTSSSSSSSAAAGAAEGPTASDPPPKDIDHTV
jgi:hypothetical protein